MEISEQRKIFNEKLMPSIEKRLLSEHPSVIFIGVHNDFDYSKYFSDKVLYKTLDIDSGKKPTIVGDICTLKFLTRYDAIIFNGIFEYVDNPFTAMENIHRALKPGGLLLIGAPYRMGCSGYWRVTTEGVKKIMEMTGFEILEIIPIGEGENNAYTYAFGRKIENTKKD